MTEHDGARPCSEIELGVRGVRDEMKVFQSIGGAGSVEKSRAWSGLGVQREWQNLVAADQKGSVSRQRHK